MKKKKRLNPDDGEKLAGMDDLINEIEFEMSERPRALKNARKVYCDAYNKLCGFIRRHLDSWKRK